MNLAFDSIIAASDEERLGLFTATAQRLEELEALQIRLQS